MSGNLSPDEVRSQSVAAMPAPLSTFYYLLRSEVVWLCLNWQDLRAIFVSGKETLDLLNRAAPRFFSNLQRMMFENALLHLCRLTDPLRSAGKDTLTILRLPS